MRCQSLYSAVMVNAKLDYSHKKILPKRQRAQIFRESYVIALTAFDQIFRISVVKTSDICNKLSMAKSFLLILPKKITSKNLPMHMEQSNE